MPKTPFSDLPADALSPANLSLTSATYRIARLEASLDYVIRRLSALEAKPDKTTAAPEKGIRRASYGLGGGR